MIRTITFLGLLLAAVMSLNAEIPVTMDPDGPPNDGGGRRKTPPMSLTAYIDMEKGNIAFSPISADEVESISLSGAADETVIQETTVKQFMYELQAVPSGKYTMRILWRGKKYKGILLLP